MGIWSISFFNVLFINPIGPPGWKRNKRGICFSTYFYFYQQPTRKSGLIYFGFFILLERGMLLMKDYSFISFFSLNIFIFMNHNVGLFRWFFVVFGCTGRLWARTNVCEDFPFGFSFAIIFPFSFFQISHFFFPTFQLLDAPHEYPGASKAGTNDAP